MFVCLLINYNAAFDRINIMAIEMATEFLNAVCFRPFFLNAAGSVCPFSYFLGAGESVCPSYGLLKFLKLAKSGQKSVRPFVKKLQNPFLPKNVKKCLKYRRCDI